MSKIMKAIRKQATQLPEKRASQIEAAAAKVMRQECESVGLWSRKSERLGQKSRDEARQVRGRSYKALQACEELWLSC